MPDSFFDMPPRSTSPFCRHSSAGARAADISRLLDPAYSSNAYASTSTSAYVDRHGDLHDPDYRHFPIPVSKRHSHSTAYNMATRPRWELADDEHDDDEFDHMTYPNRQRQYQYSKQPQPLYPLPRSFESDDTVLDEYDEDDALYPAPKPPRGVARIIHRTKREFRKRRSLDVASSSASSASPQTPTTITTAELDDAYDASHALTLTPTHHSCSRRSQRSRTSFRSERDATATSIVPIVHQRSHHYSCHSHSTPHLSSPPPSPHSHGDDHEYPHAEPQAPEPAGNDEWTPTCTHALRRQWHALAMRVRFGVFRAQKRVRQRLAGT
ncbi:hypothetical protein H0H81_009191 [Sphagnurus paluster]|uniref:Uncharacterized protein n=1 Tax=Sphagnurus paluster TaxID=117069 RepID=A0A9P7GQJ1_9AGAR|nr:hypothetical protein H0H81_009191 [Sphagnurus paluster]